MWQHDSSGRTRRTWGVLVVAVALLGLAGLARDVTPARAQPDTTAREIAVGADGSTWIIGTNEVPGGYGIYQHTQITTSGFAQAPGGGCASPWDRTASRGSSMTPAASSGV
jgi:hypothetical protein